MDKKMKKVLVTGGFGRVGSVVVPMLLESGYSVRVLDVKQNQNAPYFSKVEVAIGSLTDGRFVANAMEGIDIVCHLAALFPPLFFEEQPIIEVNVLGTFNILQAMKNAQIGRIVFASTDATYATGASLDAYDRPLTEDTAQWPSNVYGVTKVVNEVSIRKYARMFGISYVILRFFWSMRADEMIRLMFEANMYMDDIVEEDKAGITPDTIVSLCLENGEPFYDHITDFRDIGRGVFTAIQREDVQNEIFNIAAADRVDYAKEAPRIARALGRPYRKVRIKGMHNYEADITKARRILGFEPMYDMTGMVDAAIAAAEKKQP
jgi:nucleoside-diphosphate-sugar epimerase